MVSACLLGENCKYNGTNNRNEELIGRLAGHEVIPVCPEVAGGLPVPRIPAEIVNGTVRNREGQNVDAAFRAGARAILEIAKRERPDLIVLQSRSPSCGAAEIYDGTFSGKRIPGKGVFAALACEAGFAVQDVEAFLRGNAPRTVPVVLEQLPMPFSVCKVADFSGIDVDQPFCFTGRTDDEKSLVCPTERVPDNTTQREDGWRAFRICGELDFSLIGILAGISGILASNQIGIFAISTYNTDYILTKEENHRRALDALKNAGYTIREQKTEDGAERI